MQRWLVSYRLRDQFAQTRHSIIDIPVSGRDYLPQGRLLLALHVLSPRELQFKFLALFQEAVISLSWDGTQSTALGWIERLQKCLRDVHADMLASMQWPNTGDNMLRLSAGGIFVCNHSNVIGAFRRGCMRVTSSRKVLLPEETMLTSQPASDEQLDPRYIDVLGGTPSRFLPEHPVGTADVVWLEPSGTTIALSFSKAFHKNETLIEIEAEWEQ